MEILVLSNGKGEDALAVTLLKAIEEAFGKRKLPLPKFSAVPLVGDGEAYTRSGYPASGGGKNLPSHGFGGLRVISLLRDIKAGLIGMVIKEIDVLKKRSKTADLIICVGDLYPVILAAFFTDRPIIHLATAISVSFQKYNALEIALFKKRCKLVISRDSATANFLVKRGVNAKFLGNIMMDDPTLVQKTVDFGISGEKKVLGLLPSSRGDSYSNIARMLKVISHIGNQGKFEYLLSLSPVLDIKKLEGHLSRLNYRFVPNPADPVEVARIYGKTNIYVRIISGNFAGIIKRSTLVLGMTGTGNEQAAGLGTPLFLIEEGESASRKRVRQYQRLLAGAMETGSGTDEKIAAQILALVNDPRRLSKMADAGRKIMGEPGASLRMAEEILQVIT